VDVGQLYDLETLQCRVQVLDWDLDVVDHQLADLIVEP